MYVCMPLIYDTIAGLPLLFELICEQFTLTRVNDYLCTQMENLESLKLEKKNKNIETNK